MEKTVNANIDQIQFISPVHSDKTRILVAKAHMTFVAVNENGKGKMVPLTYFGNLLKIFNTRRKLNSFFQ